MRHCFSLVFGMLRRQLTVVLGDSFVLLPYLCALRATQQRLILHALRIPHLHTLGSTAGAPLAMQRLGIFVDPLRGDSEVQKGLQTFLFKCFSCRSKTFVWCFSQKNSSFNMLCMETVIKGTFMRCPQHHFCYHGSDCLQMIGPAQAEVKAAELGGAGLNPHDSLPFQKVDCQIYCDSAEEHLHNQTTFPKPKDWFFCLKYTSAYPGSGGSRFRSLEDHSTEMCFANTCSGIKGGSFPFWEEKRLDFLTYWFRESNP